MQLNAMEYNGMQWNAMECNGMRWNAMQRNAMECNRTQCNAMQRNAIEGNPMQFNSIQCIASVDRNSMYCAYAPRNVFASQNLPFLTCVRARRYIFSPPMLPHACMHTHETGNPQQLPSSVFRPHTMHRSAELLLLLLPLLLCVFAWLSVCVCSCSCGWVLVLCHVQFAGRGFGAFAYIATPRPGI